MLSSLDTNSELMNSANNGVIDEENSDIINDILDDEFLDDYNI